MPSKKPTVLEVLAQLKADAAALRAAGITEVELGGVRVVLAPEVPVPTFDDSDGPAAPEEEPGHPLDDALTFHGGKVVPRVRAPKAVG